MDILTLRSGIKKASLLLALLVLSTVSLAADIQLTWVTPELREDGTNIQEIERYNLYYTLNNVLQDTIQIDALSNTYTIQDIENGSHAVQISTVADSLESKLSDPKTIILSDSKPVKMLLTVIVRIEND